MTERVKGFTVTLAENIRIDDVQPLIDAIGMLKGVINVYPVISEPSELITETRLRNEIREKLLNVIREI